MNKLLYAIFGALGVLLIFSISGIANGELIQTIPQWTSTTSPINAISPRISGKTIYAPYSSTTLDLLNVATTTATSSFQLLQTKQFQITGTATSSIAGGLNLTSGCVGINGTCVGTGAGTVTGSGANTQVSFWTGTSALSGNSAFTWDNTNLRLGLGTSSPSQVLGVQGNVLVAGTTTAGYFVATGTIEVRSTATSTWQGGLNITSGCLGVNGTCALTSALTSLNGLTGTTQTFANDTNVTISSAGTTHTLGWSGQLSEARGGLGFAPLDASNMLLADSGSGLLLTSGATTTSLIVNASATIRTLNIGANIIGTSTFATFGNVWVTGSTTIQGALAITGGLQSTTSSALGWNLTGGCFAINGTCVGGGGGGSGTINSGTANQVPTYLTSGTTLTGTSTLSIVNELVGVGGTTSPAVGFTASTTIVSPEQWHTYTNDTTLTVDWTQGNNQTMILKNDNVTINFKKGLAGGHYTLTVCNDGTIRTITTWDSKILWSGGASTTQTQAADKCDLFSFLYTRATSSWVYFGFSTRNF